MGQLSPETLLGMVQGSGWCRMPASAFTPPPATAGSPTPTAIAPRGHGLGLAIAKAPAERMSGSLTAPNRAACGACACLTVPLADQLG